MATMSVQPPTAHDATAIATTASKFLWLWIVVIALLTWLASGFFKCSDLLYGQSALLFLILLAYWIIARAKSHTRQITMNVTITYKEILAFAFLTIVLYAIYKGYDPGELLKIGSKVATC